MADAPSAIAELREVAGYLEQSGDPVLLRHAEAIRAYDEEAAPTGRTFDDVLGLSQRGGAGPWWVQEARARRDEAIRRVRSGFLANLEVGDAVDEIARLAARRMVARTPPANDTERLLDEALRTGAKFPGRQRLREVLQGECRATEEHLIPKSERKTVAIRDRVIQVETEQQQRKRT